MKVLLVNGSPHQNGCTNRALEEVSGQLKKEGIEAELFWIGTAASIRRISASEYTGGMG